MSFSDKIREEITNKFVAKLREGVRPWLKPWNLGPHCGIPTSGSTRKPYRGINTLILGCSAMDKSYTSKWWATFNQWKNLGGSIRRGEKSTSIVLFETGKKTVENAKGEDEIKKYAFMKYFWVFNAEQVADVPGFIPQPDDSKVDVSYEKADALIAAIGATIRNGPKAYYRPGSDDITIPKMGFFTTPEDYYSTLFHELAHWCESRVDDDEKRVLGRRDYGMHELIAEIASVYMCDATGIPLGHHMDNHASYLDGWIKIMMADHSFIFRAASQASKVADFMLGFVKTAATVKKEETVEV